MSDATFIKLYTLEPSAGAEPQLLDTLSQLRDAIVALDGGLGAETLATTGDTREILFIERWKDEAAYATASGQIPSGLFKDIMRSLKNPPATKVLQAV